MVVYGFTQRYLAMKRLLVEFVYKPMQLAQKVLGIIGTQTDQYFLTDKQN